MCYVADMTQKGQLTDSENQSDTLLKLLAAKVEGCDLNPCSIGAVIWSLECIPGQENSWRGKLLSHLADQEKRKDASDCGHIESYSTRELVNIIISTGNLSSDLYVPRNVVRYVSILMKELMRRMDASPHLRSAFGGSDFASTVVACAQLYSSCVADDNTEGSKSILQFMEKISQEVKRHLSNRHSMMYVMVLHVVMIYGLL